MRQLSGDGWVNPEDVTRGQYTGLLQVMGTLAGFGREGALTWDWRLNPPQPNSLHFPSANVY